MSQAQNILAIIYDFDQTLIPYFMQRVLFDKYRIDEKKFWRDNEDLIAEAEGQGVNLEEEFAYMTTVLRYVELGKFPRLSNSTLRELGSNLDFYPGLPDFFQNIKSRIEDNPVSKNAGITLEHYVISMGFGETIKGSAIGPYLNGVFGSEFLESNGVIHYTARAIGFMKKTQYLHALNKGVNIHPDIDVNDVVKKEERRIPFENMIYVGDGFTDIPCFATLNIRGGESMCVYDSSSSKSIGEARQLLSDRRVVSMSPADYRVGSDFYEKVSSLLRIKADRVAWKKGR